MSCLQKEGKLKGNSGTVNVRKEYVPLVKKYASFVEGGFIHNEKLNYLEASPAKTWVTERQIHKKSREEN